MIEIEKPLPAGCIPYDRLDGVSRMAVNRKNWEYLSRRTGARIPDLQAYYEAAGKCAVMTELAIKRRIEKPVSRPSQEDLDDMWQRMKDMDIRRAWMARKINYAESTVSHAFANHRKLSNTFMATFVEKVEAVLAAEAGHRTNKIAVAVEMRKAGRLLKEIGFAVGLSEYRVSKICKEAGL